MSALKAIIIAAGFAALLLGSIAAFNYSVDPMCTYRCQSIDANRKTDNNYYQQMQRVLGHPDTEQILLGSSRAVSTSPLELQKQSGLNTISLGAFGSDMMARVVMLNFAQKHLHLKRVIWYADYFELMPDRVESKLTDSPALVAELGEGANLLPKKKAIAGFSSLISQDTFNASMHTSSKVNPQKLAESLGGSEGEIRDCEKEDFKGSETPQSLSKKVSQYYENYTNKILTSPQSDEYFDFFVKKLEELNAQKIAVEIYILPYHPEFTRRLKAEFPEIYQKHLQWVQKLEQLQIENVKVKNFFDGLPGVDGSPMFWNDGVHFNCRTVRKMIAN